jgi:uncharacterized protein (TIGR00106 family)
MVTAEVSIVPVGTKTASVSKYVAKAISAIKENDKVRHQLTAMGTLLEGNLDDVLEAIKLMHNSVFYGDVERAIVSRSQGTVCIEEVAQSIAHPPDYISHVPQQHHNSQQPGNTYSSSLK